MVRLKDIAMQAGVSVMTVSKALRGEPDVAAATRNNIQQLATRMGYIPNLAARGLRQQSSRLLGVVISSVTNPIYARIMLAIEERAFELKYDVIFTHSLNDPEREAECIRRLLYRRVDGLFISPVYRMEGAAPVYQQVLDQKIPAILLGHQAPFCSQFPSVETDDEAASFEMTNHLIKLGHKRIAFFAGRPTAPWSTERIEGYRRAMRTAGLELDDKLIFNAGATIEEGAAAAEQLLSEGTTCTAIQAVNDLVAIGASNILLKRGIRVPEDISITGFGNILTSEHYRIPLTTVRQPKWRLGNKAVEMMMTLIGGSQPESHRLAAELEIRQSTGAPGRGVGA